MFSYWRLLQRNKNFQNLSSFTPILDDFFLIGIHSMQGWTAIPRHGVTRKRSTKRLRYTGNVFREPTVNRCLLILDLKAIKAMSIIGQSKAFYRQRIPESRCARKETIDIDILETSRNGDRKIVQSIRITSRPTSRKREWNQLCKFWRTSTKIIPIEKT